jgi:capsular polysaccharide biosynthesis protein
MELRTYAEILLRRWWLLLLLPALAVAFSVLTYQEVPPTYGYSLRYSVSFLPIPRENMDQDPRLGAVQASEYVVDDMTLIYTGSRFASFVQQYMPEGMPIGRITEATHVEKTHRLITINMSAATEEQAVALANAVRQATENDLRDLLTELWDTQGMRMEIVNDSGPFQVGGGIRSRLEMPLRIALALAAAVALAFAWDYLDTSVRTRDEAEQLAGPVLAEIPRSQ